MATQSIAAVLSKWGPERLQALFAESPQQAAAAARVLALEAIPQAQVCYGRMLLEGTGTRQNKAEAFVWFERAAAQGDADALNMAGRCLENGWGTAVNVVRATGCYETAAQTGHAWAQYNLGHLYLDGIGVERDLNRAYQCYLAAAEQQHPRAMNLMGRCCEEGWGTARDFNAAADWYRRSAEGGYFRGQFNWATVLLRCERDEEAAVWLDRAASDGTDAVRDAILRLTSSSRQGSALQALAARLREDSCAQGA